MRWVIVAVCLSAGCTSNDVIDVTYDPCSPMVIVPGAGTSPAELASIEEAIRVWDGVIPTRIEIGAPSAEPVDGLRISFESGDTFYRAMYWDHIGLVSISREKLAPADHPLAIAHELGHAFGLFHVGSEVRPSVMNLHNLEVEPNQQDGLAVRELWAACAGEPAP